MDFKEKIKQNMDPVVVNTIIRLLILGLTSNTIIKIFARYKVKTGEVDYEMIDIIKRYYFSTSYFKKNYFMKLERSEDYNKALLEYLESSESKDVSLSGIANKYNVNPAGLRNGINLLNDEFSEKGILGLYKYFKVKDGSFFLNLYNDEKLLEELGKGVIKQKLE